MKKIANILLSFMLITSLSTFSGCMNQTEKADIITKASYSVSLYSLIKHYDRDTLTARDLMKGYPEAKPEVNQWLEDVLTVKSLLKNPGLDVIEKLRAKHQSYLNLKEHVKNNWAKVKVEDRRFVTAFQRKMDAFFKVLGAVDKKINDSERGKLLLQYLSTINQLNSALSGKFL